MHAGERQIISHGLSLAHKQPYGKLFPQIAIELPMRYVIPLTGSRWHLCKYRSCWYETDISMPVRDFLNLTDLHRNMNICMGHCAHQVFLGADEIVWSSRRLSLAFVQVSKLLV